MAIGQDPKNLPLAIVNAENNGDSCNYNDVTKECPISFGTFGLPEKNEHLANFTCRYMSFLDENVVSPMYFDNIALAEKSVKDGVTWGLIAMDKEFTGKLYERLIEDAGTEDPRTPVNMDLLNRSSVNVRMDMTNQHIAFTLQMKFIEAFEGWLIFFPTILKDTY